MRLAFWAPIIFVLLWSTGFVGAKFGLPYAEPFTFLWVRMLIVAGLLTALAGLLRSAWPRGWALNLHIGVSGLLLHAGYLGGVFFAISRGMPAGLAALIVGLQPILTALLAQPLLRERVGMVQWAGLLLGFVGVGLVVGEKALGARVLPIEPSAFAAIVLALFSTTLGTLYQKRFAVQMPLIGGTVVQYLAAAVGLFVLALLFGETMQIQWTPQFILAMAWLVLVLSVGAILLLMYLIRHNSASRVASLFYLVPPATALEAYFLFGERLGGLALLGMGLAALGVALVVRR
ncbi:DMT family transporter [Meiothermus taiwanensis]|jgi:drug/metabolite transporter (DMT)-like permease|uniref:DMT family permease n=4 Tax=Meiothermus taiwanensis TaxID=172827 RepID=A0ABN5LSE0_9DEIN|nr:DMT family transporter [Meiothermus taiwanensis]AWR85260.1 DMT family permease [Meiothermus taiwanensis WR-220]KZK17027.1 peptide ABC transporter ATP-binding protein [Meiothermus taiwanensis]RIH75975.1 putative inner membrane transporter YedA [Meiothermus taiwanensis]